MQTEALSLLPLTKEDYGWMCALYADPEVMRYIGTGPRAYEVSAAVLDKMLAVPPPACVYGVRDRATLEPLGAAMLMIRKPGSPLEIGFMLAKKAWGRGLATQAVRALLQRAFGELEVPFLEAFTHSGNDGSAKVLLKTGFRDLGVTPGPYGTPDRKFSITREEWLRQA
jgi:ribosomal-protein-alanine N-acetyltransferase